MSVALAAVVVLGMLAFGCAGGGARPVSSATPRVTARPSPTADPRVAEVQAAAKGYVEAVERSALTGNPSQVDQLVVPGSQAEGNAAITADFSRENHYNFMASRVDFDDRAWHISVEATTATVTLTYAAYGHDADWPSLHPRDADRESTSVTLNLQFEFRNGQWLVTESG